MTHALLFDWGDTVMRLFGFPGPMAYWPRVEAVPGVAEALQALQPRYRLVVATNAAESGAALVREALERAGLGIYFEAVFTAQELGACKPEPAFFQAVLEELGCAPSEAVMVGDAYRADVVGAKEAGLRAVWFNPEGAPCPLTHPVHDAEVRAMAALPGALGRMNLPDMAKCFALLAEQEVSPWIVRHVLAVAAVAFYLAGRLAGLGEEVDPLLAHRGGLLHDLDKVSAQRQGRVHGQLGAEILREKGYPQLAPVVERHLALNLLDPARRPATWEEKLVYYADRIVEDDRVVGVEERLEALCQRYADRAEAMRRCHPLVLALEEEIAGRLGVTPAAMLSELQERLL